MKLKTLLCCLAVGLMALVAENVSAFPLTLTSLNGTITSTAYYGTNAASTTNRADVTAFTLKKVLTVVSNEIFIRTSGTNAPPAGSRIVFDPYTQITYITNNNGYTYNLSASSNAIAGVVIGKIAANFHGTANNGGSESGVAIMEFSVTTQGTNNVAHKINIKGRSTLGFNVNGLTGKGTMTLRINGSGAGQYKNSDDGVATGTAVFTGSGTPEWEGPYSVWWNNQP